MPSKSKSQARFFAAAAHNPDFAKKAGISTDAAKEWNKADEKAGTLKKGSKKPEHVKEEEVHESTMRGWMDTIEDAEIANDIDDADVQTDISLRSPSMYEDAEPEYDLQGKPVQPGQRSAPVQSGTSSERFGSAQWDANHATPNVPVVPTQPEPQSPEQPAEPLQEMPQRYDSFKKQNRDDFVDKAEAQAKKNGLVPFAEHEAFDVFRTADKSALIAYDKSGKQIGMMSGIITNRAVVGVKNVFQVHSTASKTGTKGVMYQMFMDLLDNGYSVLSDSIHSPDAIKFWTRLMGNHNVYVVGDGEVLAKAKPEKAHKYWDDDEDSESAELRLLLVK